MKKVLLVVVLLMQMPIYLFAQEKETRIHQEVFRPYSRFTILMAHYMFPHLVETETGKKNDLVPAWGIDYDYWFHPKWAIGIHNDIILQKYKIERKNDATELSRSFPFSTSLVGIYKPGKHLAIISGIGREFEKDEALNLWNLALEYGFELPQNWEVSVNLVYEDKFHAYDSWIFGIGVSKSVFK